MTMREVLTPALWDRAGDIAITASATPATAYARPTSSASSMRLIVAADSFGAAETFEDDGSGSRAHALRIGFGERRQRDARSAGIGAGRLGLARKPRGPRQIDGVNEGRLFGVVRGSGEPRPAP